jgi:hypothetical protein
MNRLRTAECSVQGGLLLNELGLCKGRVRADIAVVNGCLKGYEIKSEFDTLVRLKHQAEVYSRIFDTATLVLAEKHLDAARSIIPFWWGIEIAELDADLTVRLHHFRKEEPNPSVDPHALVQLLWRDELLSIIGKPAVLKSFSREPKKVICDHLAMALPLPDLKAAVRTALKSRTGWQVAVPQSSSGEKFPPASTLSNFQFPSSRTRILRYSYRPN